MCSSRKKFNTFVAVMQLMLMRLLLALTVLFGSLSLKAQEKMGLQECINHAWEHNIQLQQNRLNTDLQDYNRKSTVASAFPTLNGFASNNYNFGRTVDPFSNQFVNQQNRSMALSLNTDVTLFQGLAKLNEIRQAKWSADAAEHGYTKAKDDVALTVANMYLQILLLQERLVQLKEQYENDSAAFERQQKLFNAGSISGPQLSEAKARFATTRVSVVDINNQLTNARLSLKQFMNYDIMAPLEIEQVSFATELANPYSSAELTVALTNQVDQMPAVKQAISNYLSARYGLKSAKGFMWPRLGASASMNTIYSSLANRYDVVFAGYEPVGFLALDSTPVLAPKYTTSPTPFTFQEQLNNNFGQSLGFTLSIPIFNGLQTQYRVQSAKVNMKSAELSEQDARNTVRNDIFKSYESMRMAFEKLEAAQIKMDAQDQLLRQTQLQFDQGLVNYFDFNAARTTYNVAQSELLQAKYEYIFQRKVFEYYLGKPISFNE